MRARSRLMRKRQRTVRFLTVAVFFVKKSFEVAEEFYLD